jgi:Na+/proline symporter
MASRARVIDDTAKESAGLLLLHQDILNLPWPSWLANMLIAGISFGIFAALASTADNNLNIAAIGISKLVFRRDWAELASQHQAQAIISSDQSPAEARLLMKCRWLCATIGFSSIGIALLLKDIVAIMVNAAWIMLLFLPATLGALLFNHRSSKAGIASIVSGGVVYVSVLAMGVPLKSAFLPGFAVSLVVYLVLINLGKSKRQT